MHNVPIPIITIRFFNFVCVHAKRNVNPKKRSDEGNDLERRPRLRSKSLVRVVGRRFGGRSLTFRVEFASDHNENCVAIVTVLFGNRNLTVNYV